MIIKDQKYLGTVSILVRVERCFASVGGVGFSRRSGALAPKRTHIRPILWVVAWCLSATSTFIVVAGGHLAPSTQGAHEMPRSNDKAQRKLRDPPTALTLAKRCANKDAKIRHISRASENGLLGALGVVIAAPAAPRTSL